MFVHLTVEWSCAFDPSGLVAFNYFPKGHEMLNHRDCGPGWGLSQSSSSPSFSKCFSDALCGLSVVLGVRGARMPGHWVVSDSLRLHGPSPTRLRNLWDFPGKHPGGCCHFLLQVWKEEELMWDEFFGSFRAPGVKVLVFAVAAPSLDLTFQPWAPRSGSVLDAVLSLCLGLCGFLGWNFLILSTWLW